MPDLLTAEIVRSATPPAKGQKYLWDADPKHGGVAGFGLRITAKGAKTFVINYRFADPGDRRKSNQYRFAIGPAKILPRGGGWTVDAARQEAGRWRRLIDRGETHPLAQRKGRREAADAARRAETFKSAVEDYIEHEAQGRRNNATAGEVKRALLKGCSEWLDWPVGEIKPGEIGKLLRQVRDGDAKQGRKAAPYMANRLHAYLATFFRWCAKPDVAKVQISPMLGVDRPWEGEEVRDRVFSDVEIRALWHAADAIGGIGGAYTKVLILTGKRKSALAAMRWDELSDAGVWTPPGDPRRRKRTKRLHGIPLPGLAQRIIQPLRPTSDKAPSSVYVFPGRVKGSHLYPGSDLAAVLRKESGVADFFFHAIRHTLETGLAELGVLPHVRDLILDHAPTRGAGAGYDHYVYGKEIGLALEHWAAHIEKIVSPKGVAVLR